MPAPTRHAALRTYVDPLKNKRRALVFLGKILGPFGFGLINTFSAYDLSGGGYSALCAYFVPSLLVTGLLYWPLLYAGFSVIDSVKWRLGVIALQLTAIALYIIAPPDPLWRGIAAGIVMAPFWASFHVAMVQNTTDENRGFEVTLSLYLGLLSSVLMALTTAHFLNAANALAAVTIAMAAMTAGTVCFLAASSIARQKSLKGYVNECKKTARDNPYMARRIISQCVMEAASFSMAALMFKVGISPSLMATIMIARLILMTFVSPLVGKIAQSNRKHGYAIGLGFIGLSWVLLSMMPSSPFVFFVFLILYAVGHSFADSALLSGLYEMQSYASMMWSEIYMAIGRGIGLIAFVPLMFVDVRLYLLSLAALAAALYVFNRRWQRRWSEAGAM